jgi:ABC-2 type transport system ATP-binding protein
MPPLPDIALTAVGLRYRLAKQRIPSLKEYAIHWLKGALRYEALWALDGLDLVIAPGQRVGIVGRNGAGKSTLLKLISGILEPTCGTAIIRRRVTPILELGTGFDLELTGLENLHLNALLLGRRRREVLEKVDAIVATSGLGDFLHAPLRNYSSGMQARLGFAIATAWVPEILILDEVLAVGDAEFVELCRARLESFRAQGTTVLLVSHNLDDIAASCERSLWLDAGRLRADGPTAEVLAAYRDEVSRRATTPR